ncbi:MAG: YitT family protein [Malacoplasma sp.]|nr:YitT family protein [Malacoplasma sp.]
MKISFLGDSKKNNQENETDLVNTNIQTKGIEAERTIKRPRKEKKAPKPLPPPTYVVTHYKSTIGLFSKVYSRSDWKWRVFIMCLVGFFMGFVSLLFIQNTGVYVSGTSGIFQGIARVIKVVMKEQKYDEEIINITYNLLFYLLYLFTNIPLIIFSWKKMGKKFTILSCIPVVISNVLPLLFNLIPGMNTVFIFGDTRTTITKIVNSEMVYELSKLSKEGVQLLTFQDYENSTKLIYMFLYCLAAGLINGVAYSLALSVGGSTGGLDFITFYFSYRKKKSLGPTLLIFNTSSIFISSVIGSYLAGGLVNSDYHFYNIISANLLSGVIYTITVTVVLGNLFPKDRVVKIQVYSENVIDIRNKLYSMNFNHSLTINTTTGGYSLQEKRNIEIICLFIEIPKILRQIKSIDDTNVLITITPIKGIDGKLSVEDALN